MADWSLLPEELLPLIAKCLKDKNPFDILHFRAVCTTWRASAPLKLRTRPYFSSARRLLRINRKGHKHFISHYNTVCLFKYHVDDNNSSIPRFWFVKLVEDDLGKISIFDPLSSWKKLLVEDPIVLDISKLHFQEVSRNYRQVIDRGDHKISISAAVMEVDLRNDNDEGQFIVLESGRSAGCLTFTKFGDEEATTLEVEGYSYRMDFIQFKRKFYAVDCSGTTVCLDPCSRTTFLVEKTFTLTDYGYLFLVELCGNLLLVEQIHMAIPTSGFVVFELDEERKRWNRLQSLGDGILFLGTCCNFSASAIPGVEGNCIIYTYSNYIEGVGSQEETVVFHLSSGITVPLKERPDLLQLFRSPFHRG